ncbi:MAG: glycosyltransferase [bacterium]|nr:glycosyltransferase [bacterium]
MIKVSVIVPVYNVEPYLKRCLESLVNQTLKEIEIVVVNDGSTDQSGKIAKAYADKYEKIKYYEKKNGGLSDARNYGLQFVTGEYLGYVDSDDFVDDTMYELLYHKAKEDDSDIVECNLRHTYKEYEDIEIGKKIQDKKELLMFGRSVVWNKIYRTDWLKETKVKFHKSVYYEDIEFYLKLIPYLTCYSYIDEASIHYVQRSSSINNQSSSKTLDILKVLTSIYEYYRSHGFLEDYKDALEFFYTRILLCSSFKRMCRIKDRKQRADALNQSIGLLYSTFPDWKKNKTLRSRKSIQNYYMRTITPTTYKIYSAIFSVIFRMKIAVKAKKV